MNIILIVILHTFTVGAGFERHEHVSPPFTSINQCKAAEAKIERQSLTSAAVVSVTATCKKIPKPKRLKFPGVQS